ncbi:hypothetical protein HYFRA_00013950 [Hymenoscyphus fraxineus]|uniref:Saccharopine dehydrogenase [NAD(+), L-lysine-forming] n=1 Tax=Hymenoscyphus fraxineus TaxID=746836 RepID=A0A9N9LC85_9HELO|nr:hypothetical protein HYFRA_00013950 [Hymenoscyphus fraxineus]
MTFPTIHLRSESKPFEARSALTPTTAKALLDAGYSIHVEHSPVRVFDDDEFAAVGATMVPEGSWIDAPLDHLILGLKELPDGDDLIRHTHITFHHIYKYQAGWKHTLQRFLRGGGMLLDLEYLTETTGGKRVAAFGYHAGFSGAALALKTWSWQKTHSIPNGNEAIPLLPAVEPFPNEQALVKETTDDIRRAVDEINKEKLARGDEKTAQLPKVLVMGALGRCGSGAIDFLERAGIPSFNISKWDIDETKAGGPFAEILCFDIFVNCIFLADSIPPFITLEMVKEKPRNLSVIADVSCDAMSPFNPIPIYDIYTTFREPTVRILGAKSGEIEKVLDVISIDHLPTMVPREASEAFSKGILPNLLKLKDWKEDRAWKDVENKFFDAVVKIL